MSRWPCWCTQLILRELFSMIIMQTFSFVSAEKQGYWSREWKHYRENYQDQILWLVRTGLEPGISSSQGKRPNHWVALPPVTFCQPRSQAASQPLCSSRSDLRELNVFESRTETANQHFSCQGGLVVSTMHIFKVIVPSTDKIPSRIYGVMSRMNLPNLSTTLFT